MKPLATFIYITFTQCPSLDCFGKSWNSTTTHVDGGLGSSVHCLASRFWNPDPVTVSPLVSTTREGNKCGGR